MLVWILRCLGGSENILYLMTDFKMKVCIREKKPETTFWVTCGLSPLLVYTVVKRSFFLYKLTYGVNRISINISQ